MIIQEWIYRLALVIGYNIIDIYDRKAKDYIEEGVFTAVNLFVSFQIRAGIVCSE